MPEVGAVARLQVLVSKKSARGTIARVSDLGRRPSFHPVCGLLGIGIGHSSSLWPYVFDLSCEQRSILAAMQCSKGMHEAHSPKCL